MAEPISRKVPNAELPIAPRYSILFSFDAQIRFFDLRFTRFFFSLGSMFSFRFKTSDIVNIL
jgi:hypothetical protein